MGAMPPCIRIRTSMKVSTTSLNQTPLSWTSNIANIQSAINEAKTHGADLLVTPELSISGYGCEDAFYMEDISKNALEALHTLKIPKGMVVTVGLPVLFWNRLYNAVALLKHSDDGAIVQGISFKKTLAMNGIHYEARWFSRWEATSVIETDEITGYKIPVGDPVFSYKGARIGFETCEESWVPNRAARTLFDRGVNLIVNASASHFAIGKFETRKQLVIEGSRAFGAAYVYSNLNGCEAGRAIYDGGCLIASGGKLVAQGERFHYSNHAIITSDIDLHENQLTHQLNSQQATTAQDYQGIFKIEDDLYLPVEKLPSLIVNEWERSQYIEHEEAMRAVALGLRDWSHKTWTNGYTLSLSGGADSGLVAVCTYLSVLFELEETYRKRLPFSLQVARFISPETSTARDSNDLISMTKGIMSNYMQTLYQGTTNSSDTTLNAAKRVAEGIGANHHDWTIDEMVNSYSSNVENVIGRKLTWEKDDIPLQNIQARVRAPGVWMLANIENKLLLTTSNMSEGAVGYVTMDGDSSGVLAPISGITKGRILKLLEWLYKEGISFDGSLHKMDFLDCIVEQKPTAELRPEEQNDEDDLMPFPVLDRIVELFMVRRKNKETIMAMLLDEFDLSKDTVEEYVEKFFKLFKRNQWKRERQAPGFHIEINSLDPKTYGRFPLLTA